MSSDSLAAFRNNAGSELADLAEQHLQHDLTESDRNTLTSAASKFSTHATIGSVIGLGLGIFMATRVRGARKAYFQAFRATERPTHVQFAGGRTGLLALLLVVGGFTGGLTIDIEPLPDLEPLLKPSTLGDVAAYTLFSFGGLFIGGETGMLTGAFSAQRSISADPEAKKRIETAFRKFKADVLRKQAKELDVAGEGVTDRVDWSRS